MAAAAPPPADGNPASPAAAADPNAAGDGANPPAGGAPADGTPTAPGAGTPTGSGSVKDNPFAGAVMYVNPDYTKNAKATKGQAAGDAALIAKASVLPTGVWIDRIAAINGGAANSGRLSLTGHLDTALKQAAASKQPAVVVLVVYDLPNRDCAAAASNGELKGTAGLATYQSKYIDAIAAAVTSKPEYKDLRLVMVVEPDSLPNMVTNVGIVPACDEVKKLDLYKKGVTYALQKLSAIDNAYLYLDMGHSGWLGWPNNMDKIVPYIMDVIKGAKGGDVSVVRGFATDVANVTPLQEPFLKPSDASMPFYESNPIFDEVTFAKTLATRFAAAGLPKAGFIIDTLPQRLEAGRRRQAHRPAPAAQQLVQRQGRGPRAAPHRKIQPVAPAGCPLLRQAARRLGRHQHAHQCPGRGRCRGQALRQKLRRADQPEVGCPAQRPGLGRLVRRPVPDAAAQRDAAALEQWLGQRPAASCHVAGGLRICVLGGDVVNFGAHAREKPMHPKSLTNNFGAPLPDNENSQSAGARGPLLLQDYQLQEKLAHLARERIPERVVHAKGAGALGHFEASTDMSAHTRAHLFGAVGRQTQVLVRFSTVGGERGSTDAERDPRGFAIKFYSAEGNYDLVGNNTPVFFLRDPFKFADMVHTHKRHPQTNLKDPEAFWDFHSHSPESIHQLTILFSDRGIPRSYRQMHGFGSHTFRWVNASGHGCWVKYHFKTETGIANLTQDEAQALMARDPDHATRDLFEHIRGGGEAAWRAFVQIMPESDADTYDVDPFDVTKIWRYRDYPLLPIGRLVLNRNPDNYFAQIEQAAFSPANFVPGIEPSPDKLLQGRLFSYPDAQRYRLGGNYALLPVNCPMPPGRRTTSAMVSCAATTTVRAASTMRPTPPAP